MTQQLFSNNAATTLAAPITAVATSLSVAPGTGLLFQSPTGVQFETGVLIDQDTGDFEIVKITGRSVDTFTIEREQEGTTGLAFTAGALFEGRVSKGTLQRFAQLDDAVSVTGDWAFAGDQQFTGELTAQRGINVLALTGTDTYSGDLAPAITGYVLGAEYMGVPANTSSSGTPTCEFNSLGAKTVVRDDTGSTLNAGDMVAGRPCKFLYDGTYLRLLNPATMQTNIALTGNPTAVTQAPLNDSQRLATTEFVNNRFDRCALRSMGTIKFGGQDLSQNATRYLGGFGVSYTGTEADVQSPLPSGIPIEIKDVKVTLSAAVPGGETIDVRVRVDGTNVLTDQLVAGETTADIAGPYLVDDPTAARLLSVQYQTSSGFGTTNDIKVTMRIVYAGTDIAVPFLPLGRAATSAQSGYATEFGSATGNTTTARFQVPLSKSILGRMEGYDINSTMRLQRNGSTIYTGLVTGTYTNKFFFEDDDLFSMYSASNLAARITLSFAPDDKFLNASQRYGHYCPLLFGSYEQAQGTTLYASGFGQTGIATEAPTQFRLAAGKLVRLRGHISAALGSGETVTVTLRKNGVDQLMQLVFDENTLADLVEVDLTNEISILDTDLLSWSVVSSSLAGTQSVNFSVEHTADE